jgi:hypothetical protein
MKAYILLAALAGFIFPSCDTGDYPPYRYTNNSAYNVSFKTREADSPVYTLDPGASMRLDSTVWGRADIDDVSINPPYITWDRGHNDIYNIEFKVDGEPIPMEIRNFTDDTITLKEARGYIEPADEVTLEPKDKPGSEDKTRNIFTETPSFIISIISGYTYPARVDYRIEYHDDGTPLKMYVSISR